MNVFVLFRPSMDWVMPTHFVDHSLLLFFFFFFMCNIFIQSLEILTFLMTSLKALLWDIIIVLSKVVLKEKLQKRTESSKGSGTCKPSEMKLKNRLCQDKHSLNTEHLSLRKN